jgi:iron complex transport system substrate-binding protein
MKKWLVIIGLIMSIFPTFAQEESAECEAGFRLVEHAFGVTCVPELPEKIIPLDLVVFDLLIEMGVQPAGVPQIVLDTYLTMHPDLEEKIAEFDEELVDIGFPPNVEKILSIQPDLIISPRDFFAEILYPQLSQVAPTVLFDPIPGDWATRLLFAGEVFGESELAEQLLADFEARVEQLAEFLPPEEAEAITLSLVRVLPGQIGMVISASGAQTLLDQVGLSRPESQTYDYDYVLEEMDGWPEIRISMEELFLVDADYIFIFGTPEEITDDPLWQSLSAVQEGRAFEVGYYWWGDSLYSAHKMLDDIYTHIAGVDLETLKDEVPVEEDAE